jgi:hypothetical protein
MRPENSSFLLCLLETSYVLLHSSYYSNPGHHLYCSVQTLAPLLTAGAASATAPWNDDFERSAAVDRYLSSGMLLPPLLLLFGATKRSVANFIVGLVVAAFRLAGFIVSLQAPSVTMVTPGWKIFVDCLQWIRM